MKKDASFKQTSQAENNYCIKHKKTLPKEHIIKKKRYGTGKCKLTKAGELFSSSLTSTTFPETGALISLVALTLSTAPKLAPCFTVVPTSGNSTYTTSPKWSWAWSVMPTVAELPSTLTHSWESAYFRSFITAERMQKWKLTWKKSPSSNKKQVFLNYKIRITDDSRINAVQYLAW